MEIICGSIDMTFTCLGGRSRVCAAFSSEEFDMDCFGPREQPVNSNRLKNAMNIEIIVCLGVKGHIAVAFTKLSDKTPDSLLMNLFASTNASSLNKIFINLLRFISLASMSTPQFK
jgi:hypothetical protein